MIMSSPELFYVIILVFYKSLCSKNWESWGLLLTLVLKSHADSSNWNFPSDCEGIHYEAAIVTRDTPTVVKLANNRMLNYQLKEG